MEYERGSGLSILFGVVAADGGLLVSFEITTVEASVFITSISFAIYVLARAARPALRSRRRDDDDEDTGGPGRPAQGPAS